MYGRCSVRGVASLRRLADGLDRPLSQVLQWTSTPVRSCVTSGEIEDSIIKERKSPNPVKQTNETPSNRFAMFIGLDPPEAMSIQKKPDKKKEPEEGGLPQDFPPFPPDDTSQGLAAFVVDEKEEQRKAEQQEASSPPDSGPLVELHSQKIDKSAERTEGGEAEDEAGDIHTDFIPGLATDNSSVDLENSDLLKYYAIDVSLVPEAFPEDFEKENFGEEQKQVESEGGGGDIVIRKTKKIKDKFINMGLTLELQESRNNRIMARKSIVELMNRLKKKEFRKGKRYWLEGREGSGKSVALGALAEFARKQNWLVMYIPSAKVITHDYFFYRRGEDGTYDTPHCADQFLKRVLATHKDVLPTLQQQYKSKKGSTQYGETLEDLCTTGISSNQPDVKVDCVIKLLHEFLFVERDMPALVLIDDYNALYWRTLYGRWPHNLKREEIPPQEVTLVKPFRLFEQLPSELHGCVIVAPGYSQGVRPRLDVHSSTKKHKNKTKWPIDRFNREEVKRMMSYYWNCGKIDPVGDESLARLHAITGGNGHELRKNNVIFS